MRTLLLSLGILALLLPGCSNKKTARKPSPLEIVASPVAVHPSQEFKIPITIKIKSPYHFNKEFPSVLKVAETDGLTFPQKSLGIENFKEQSPQLVRIEVPAKAPKASGDHTPKFSLNCSVCTEEECLILKAIAIEAEVHVK